MAKEAHFEDFELALNEMTLEIDEAIDDGKTDEELIKLFLRYVETRRDLTVRDI